MTATAGTDAAPPLRDRLLVLDLATIKPMQWLRPGPLPLGELLIGALFALVGVVTGFLAPTPLRGALDFAPPWVVGGFLLVLGAFFIVRGLRGIMSRNKL